jgi:SNW domain-containing protein 1
MLSSLPAPTRPTRASPPPGDGGGGPAGPGPSSSAGPPKKEPPPYGRRGGFVPRTQADFGDGGELTGMYG